MIGSKMTEVRSIEKEFYRKNEQNQDSIWEKA
jgi:hypothetical protein